jgi:hypothetical protein
MTLFEMPNQTVQRTTVLECPTGAGPFSRLEGSQSSPMPELVWSASPPPWFLTFHLFTLGDMNGDGYDDLVVRIVTDVEALPHDELYLGSRSGVRYPGPYYEWADTTDEEYVFHSVSYESENR